MNVPVAGLDRTQVYKLLVGSVVPRPIAWITSLSDDGVVNLAPFSAFTWVCQEPPMIGVAITLRAGALKDTARNAAQHGSFVVNIADETMLDHLQHSSRDYPAHVSEVDELDLALRPSAVIDVPRLADVPAALECRYVESLAFGVAGQLFVIGESDAFYVRDDLVSDGKIDNVKMRPLARLGGPTYAHLGRIVHVTPQT
jgi:flavin reductase (DIM6/NTAB) family NADH-FMN oxidoreductase RutF